MKVIKLTNEQIMKEEKNIETILDEAAEEYAKVFYHPLEDRYSIAPQIKYDSFKAGAKWMETQMMKDSVEGMVKYHDYPEYKYVLVPYDEFNDGDKVHMIVLKTEDESK